MSYRLSTFLLRMKRYLVKCGRFSEQSNDHGHKPRFRWMALKSEDMINQDIKTGVQLWPFLPPQWRNELWTPTFLLLIKGKLITMPAFLRIMTFSWTLSRCNSIKMGQKVKWVFASAAYSCQRFNWPHYLAATPHLNVAKSCGHISFSKRDDILLRPAIISMHPAIYWVQSC